MVPGEGVEPSDQPPHIVVMAHGFTDRDGEHPAWKGGRDSNPRVRFCRP